MLRPRSSSAKANRAQGWSKTALYKGGLGEILRRAPPKAPSWPYPRHPQALVLRWEQSRAACAGSPLVWRGEAAATCRCRWDLGHSGKGFWEAVEPRGGWGWEWQGKRAGLCVRLSHVLQNPTSKEGKGGEEEVGVGTREKKNYIKQRETRPPHCKSAGPS